MGMKHNRFKDVSWYSEEPKPILLGGAGGISSWTALLLTRANFSCIVYDADFYEEHNMSGQFVSQANLGMPKVESLFKDIKAFTGDEITPMNEWFTAESMSNDIMVGGFDNMEARKLFFYNWLEYIKTKPESERKDCLFIDGRLLAEQYQILSFTGDDDDAIAKYQSDYLFGDNEVEEAMCTLKQTSHIAAMIAARITTFVTNHIVNMKFGRVIQKIPFFFEEYAPLLMVTEKSAQDGDQQSV